MTDPQRPGADDDRAARWLEWAHDTFGEVALEPVERTMRFVEEAIELAQSMSVDTVTLSAIIERVYSRPRGTISREIGQCQATLELLARVLEVDPGAESAMEFARVQSIPQEEWTRRHAAKAKLGIARTSPLTGADDERLARVIAWIKQAPPREERTGITHVDAHLLVSALEEARAEIASWRREVTRLRSPEKGEPTGQDLDMALQCIDQHAKSGGDWPLPDAIATYIAAARRDGRAEGDAEIARLRAPVTADLVGRHRTQATAALANLWLILPDEGFRKAVVQVAATLAVVQREAREAAIEGARTTALEQRCERGTPWDLACTVIAGKIGALSRHRTAVRVAIDRDGAEGWDTHRHFG